LCGCCAGDRVSDLREYDRNRDRELLHDREQRRAVDDQDVRGQADEFARVGLHVLGSAANPTRLQLNFAALGPSQLV